MATKAIVLAVALAAGGHWQRNEAAVLITDSVVSVYEREARRHQAAMEAISNNMTVDDALAVLRAHASPELVVILQSALAHPANALHASAAPSSTTPPRLRATAAAPAALVHRHLHNHSMQGALPPGVVLEDDDDDDEDEDDGPPVKPVVPDVMPAKGEAGKPAKGEAGQPAKGEAGQPGKGEAGKPAAPAAVPANQPKKPKKRKAGYSPKVIKAKDMLNQMIYEVQTQYEVENKKCCDYEHTRRSIMEDLAQDISLFNAEAAQGRALILSAQQRISLAEGRLPRLRQAALDHGKQCSANMAALKRELTTVAADKDTMTTMASLTECKRDQALMQIEVLQCLNPCTKETHMLFSNRRLRKAARKLRSHLARRLMRESLAKVHAQAKHHYAASGLLQQEVDEEMVDDYNNASAASGLLQQGVDEEMVDDYSNANPVAPRFLRPKGPCEKPIPTDKKSANCKIGPGSCELMQERLQLIYAEILDKSNELQAAINKLERDCKTVTISYESQMGDLSTQLNAEQAALAAATKSQNTADEQSRIKAVEKTNLQKEFDTMTGTCHKNYQAYEDQLCGLTKLRGELLKVKAPGSSLVVEDCKLGAWTASPCSKSCGGGTQTLTRSVIVAPLGGVKCLPLTQVQPCNSFSCPVDCQLSDWQSWSGCTAECGGGIMQRARPVRAKPRFGGMPCGENSQVSSCNQQSCNANCQLNDWTAWSACSMACDGGRQRRIRHVAHKARGTGSCPHEKAAERLDFKPCNTQLCPASLACQSKLDVILLLDGSSRVGSDGFESIKLAGQQLVRSLGSAGKVQTSVILFSGPQSLQGLRICTNEDPSRTPNMERDCLIKVVSHLDANHFALADRIKELSWPQGSALTSAALSMAEAELQNGRKDANAVVLIITRGTPLSIGKTTTAALNLRKKARVMWVPVIGKESLEHFRKWSSDPDEENIIPIAGFPELKSLKLTDRIVASMCAAVSEQVLPPPVQHEWDFRECNGNVKDTHSSLVARLNGGVCGPHGIHLDGKNQFVAYDPWYWGGAIAIEASVKYDDFQVWSRVFDCGLGPFNSDIILSNTGDTADARWEVNTPGASKQDMTVPGVWLKGSWVHIVGTISGGVARLYRNGVLVGTRSGLKDPDIAMRTKCWTGKSNYEADKALKGTVAYVRTWQGYTFNDAQVAALYAKEVSRYSYYVVYNGNIVLRTTELKAAKQQLLTYTQANTPPERMICEVVDGVVTPDPRFLGPAREIQERPGLFVTLYENCDFTGGSNTLRPGKYEMNQMGTPDNWLSSIRVPPGFKVTLYEHNVFQGRELVLTGNTPCLVGLNFNDITSSIKVEESGSAVNNFWANEASASKMLKTCEEEAMRQVKACELNPPETARTYSSIFANDPTGTGHARSMLNSEQAWSAAKNEAGQWMQLDLGGVQDVTGIAVQGRFGAYGDQRVTKFSVKYSLNNKDFLDVPGKFDRPGDAPPNKVVRRAFPETVHARYVRIVVEEWQNHISMRAAVSICKAR